MAQFQINYLGCGSATPTMRHLPSCQVVDFRDNLFMIDCGECAQLSLRRMQLKFSRLNHIFISHLHGDHCLGLTGMLSTLALTGREGGTITIHTFKEGAEIFSRMLDFFCKERPFEIKYNIIPHGATERVFENDSLEVTAFPLYHRVPCTGYIFREKPKPRHLKGDMLKFHNVPLREYQSIKAGADFINPDGKIIANSMLTSPPDPCVSYAYCSDTMFDERVAKAVEGVDTIYHEATYTESYHEKARSRGHSTAAEAATIARLAGASRLVLGHYSKRYRNEEEHLAEARAIFPNTILSYEGLKLDLL
ncbi:MAG: ribonuclease Z [Bacteroides sp.]|nr:ribonuclease Z [Bacteroides sp.]